MSTVLATAQDLAAWLDGAAPSTCGPMLRRASLLVRAATVTAIYDVGEDGLPSDPDQAQALKDAVCAQAAEWIRLGITGGGQLPEAVTSSSMLGASVAYDTSMTQAAAAASLQQLGSEAALILADTGLLSAAVST